MAGKEDFSVDKLFDATMERDWKYVEEAYRENPPARRSKLTKSEDTALHIALSFYDAKRTSSDECHIKGMINSIAESEAFEILSMKNDKGNTPLHLAAAVGSHSICKCIASKCPQLINTRNAKGETPMFVAAFHGNLDAFLYLNQLNMNGNHQPDESLCRREDGNTILHAAISGEYLKLAFQIIRSYKKLVNAVNVEGELPLHVLARKPSLFESSTDFRYFDSIIYHGVIVNELKILRDPRDSVYRSSSRINCPENYKTCIDIFFLFFTPIKESITAGLSKYTSKQDQKQNQRPADEENPSRTEKEPQSNRDQEQLDEDGSFPPHNATCFRLLKFFMKVTLTVIGVGYWRIQKIQEKRKKHSHAIQIMEEMITELSYYKYENYGQEPEEMEETQGRVPPPPNPPSTSDAQEGVHHSDTETNGGRSLPHDQPQAQINGVELDENESAKRDNQVAARSETPILVAAKMGIREMVEKIIDKFPVAIYDLDSRGKNVLMLAAENRQTAVFNYLVDKSYAGFLCRQLDDEGNSTLHLAAALGEFLPWPIPGAALQMQWEIKWYKHVKHSVPQLSFAHNNNEGETSRNIFTKTHKILVKDGEGWLIKTSKSCSVVAALIATVAFTTSATVPGGLNEGTGRPVLEKRPAFDVFSITSLVALTLAVTALVFFLSITTSRCQERDFKLTLPRQLLMGLSSLFASIVAMLVSFCAGHTFILRDKLKYAAVPLYAVASIPVTFFILMQLPLYFDLLWAAIVKVPRHSYKVFHH